MNALAMLVLALIAAMLTGDWWIKRRRIQRLPDLSDEAFLDSYPGAALPSAPGRDILRLRSQIAKELGLPVSKLSPLHRFTEHRDQYCLMISGHVALDDLLEDLLALRRRAHLPAPQHEPATVSDYLDLALEAFQQPA